MNGVHDMGGMQDMGPIRLEKNEPVFHAEWERRAFANAMAVDGDWNLSEWRSQLEQIPPAEYLRLSYYEKWLETLTQLLLKTHVVTAEEIASGKSATGNAFKGHVLQASEVESMVHAVRPWSRDVPAIAKFRVGQRVRARNINPTGHTRLPRYARGKTGTVVRDYGVFVFNDSHGQGLGEKPQHLYSVKFAARELWGEQGSASDEIYVDLWDDHLEAV